ncbi:sensor histidine kinase [Curtobacterium herbarum]|uniref:histidine kinase n=1 Tax=Curtobacterium herbarum TaxID=150122 RepID=A0ABN1Z8D5_9MICO|nr:histidine kinase [Curtobacterium herbarum]MBM7476534.1 signal transduction histidine kinase [Curtobacterium herbarum]MCS6543904.1 histidine kinase [Curtobacterium herbarum]
MRPLSIPPWARAALAGIGFLAVALLAMEGLHRAGWYPTSLDDYRITAALVALCIGVGQRLPYPLLVVVGVVVGWPMWTFGVPTVRLIPLVIAVYLACAAGRRVLAVLAVVVVPTLSALFLPLAFAPAESWVLAVQRWPLALLLGRTLLETSDWSTIVLMGILLVASAFLGRATARRRRSELVLQRRNEELVRLREADQARIASEERTAVAREVHDVVAHHMAAIVVRSQALVRVGVADQAEFAEYASWVAGTGQQALSEMRKVVRVLRAGGDGGTTDAPVSLRSALEAAVDRVRATGVRVDADLRVPETLGVMQDFAVLRVCQEALTNTLVHSDGSSVRISLAASEDRIRLEVLDDGGSGGSPRVPELAAGGAGIRGMRERAASIGGVLDAGPAEGGGWRVTLEAPREARGQTAGSVRPVPGSGAGPAGPAGPVGLAGQASAGSAAAAAAAADRRVVAS